jgi:DHA1 family multidrug resistance protein-like MFS transporter
MLLPAFHSYVARVAPKESLASYFGFSNLAMAVGGSLSNLLGGILYNVFTQNHVTGLFWIGLSMLAFLPAAGAMVYQGIGKNSSI